MGRLFWKFFLAIWGALLTAGVGVGLSVALLRPEPRRDTGLDAGPRAVFIVNTAASVLQHGGAAALRQVIADWDRSRPERAPVFVVDSNDVDILGRAVPAVALAHARLWARSGGGPAVPAPAGRAEPGPAVREVLNGDGRPLLLFVPLEVMAPRRAPELPPGVVAPLGPSRHGPSPWLPVGAGLLASLAFSALLAWYFAKPVRHLRWAFGVVADGQLDTRVQPLMGARRDEIADLGRDFDRMVLRLHQLILAQRRLLHDVSHELRSPLARLQLAIDLARQDPDKMATALDRVELESGRLDTLVGELLTLSRLETGTAAIGKTRIDLAELVASVADDAQFEARACEREVTFLGASQMTVAGDVDLLMRAVENVVRNAVKYTVPHSTVEVTLLPAESLDAAIIRVCDRGPGVPTTELDSIFEPFQRGENVGEQVGFGLGLTIARRAVEAHGGMIVATNRPGGGLMVEIRLPLC